MAIAPRNSRSARTGLIVLLGLASAKLLIHLLTNAFAGYGIFRDELYYLACASRVDLGYVDQPPLSIYLLAFNRLLFGDSLFALRLLPALAGAATVVVVGLVVRRLGGGTFAIVLACISLIVSPSHLSGGTYYSMNAFDILLWALGGYMLLMIVDQNKPQHWLLLGLIIGLGLLNKISMGWFAAGIFVALIATKQREHLATRWPYITAVIAVAIFLPYIIWNIRYDFAHLEFIRNATSQKYSALTPVDFLLGQFMVIHPATAPVWAAGLFYLLCHHQGRRYRLLGIVFVTAALILVVNVRSKPEYLASAYAILFAAGGVQLEEIARRARWAWLKIVLPLLIVLGGVATAPITLPFLPVKTYIAYTQFIGLKPSSSENKELSELHQFYADMFGWEGMAATISEVYTSLTPEERGKTVFYGRNYGRAGAVEYYTRKFELPPVISPHNSYWIWGIGTKEYAVLIVIDGTREDLQQYFYSVEQPATIRCEYCMPYENNRPVFLCRNPKENLRAALSKIWPRDKHYE